MRADVQGHCQGFYDTQRWVAPTALKFADIAVGQASRVRQCLDSETLFLSRKSDIPPENLPQIH